MERKGEEKLREINEAYAMLRSYSSSRWELGKSKDIKTSVECQGVRQAKIFDGRGFLIDLSF